ncbi:3-oxoadipate enol-lactonase [Neisseriaceae bacterium TC5R-5]|nr:3-oxoadipate enol-lactonase [Neisseriaceae bacterium TC5R-5]
MPYLNLGGRRLHYCLDGVANAPVLVLSNSLGTTLALWQPQLAALSREFRVLRYDTRGHGQSELGSGAVTLAALGEEVLALLDALDIERAHFCGISMGGLIGQWLGINAPQRLHKLVLCNTAARIGNEEAWRTRAALVRSSGMAEVAAGSAGRWFSGDFTTAEPETVAGMVQQLQEVSPAGYAACCDALAEADLRAELGKVHASTLVVAGLQDGVTTPAEADFIASHIVGAQRVDLPAAHLSNIEAAKQFNAAITLFLRD